MNLLSKYETAITQEFAAEGTLSTYLLFYYKTLQLVAHIFCITEAINSCFKILFCAILTIKYPIHLEFVMF